MKSSGPDELSKNDRPEPTARFLRACHRLPVDATPVWFMRQAGRYMPEYRALRARYSLLQITQQPDLAAEVTLQPVSRLGVDAAILFADILLILQPMGFDLDFVPGQGPAINNPVRTEEDLRKLRQPDPDSDLGHVMEAIRLLRRELSPEVSLIGFAGAPFTVASYAIEGGPSKNHLKTKSLMYSRPEVWKHLMYELSRATIAYLQAQIRAGAQAVQLFDSWAGILNPRDYETYVLPYSTLVLESLSDCGVPVIHFGTVTATLLNLMAQAGGSVIGLDWRIPLDEGWAQLGDGRAVQGNLDPAALLAPLPVLRQKVRDVLDQAGGRPGHIFNLGHGIYPTTPVENVRAVVELVHEWTDRNQA